MSGELINWITTVAVEQLANRQSQISDFESVVLTSIQAGYFIEQDKFYIVQLVNDINWKRIIEFPNSVFLGLIITLLFAIEIRQALAIFFNSFYHFGVKYLVSVVNLHIRFEHSGNDGLQKYLANRHLKPTSQINFFKFVATFLLKPHPSFNFFLSSCSWILYEHLF